MLSSKSKAAAVAALGGLGLFLSRWHGGGFISGSPKVLKNILWALPFAGVAFFAHTGTAAWVWAGVALALCLFGKATGHGGGMDLAHSPKEPGGNPSRSPENLERLIIWLYDDLPRYWYDALILVLVGFAAVSGAAIAVAVVNPLAGILIALGGCLKALAYMVGWAAHDHAPQLLAGLPDDFDEATEIGEALTGFFAYTALGLAAWMVLA